MTQWEQYQFESRIEQILRDSTQDYGEDWGRPFMTAYQLAIEFAIRWPADFQALDLPIGGQGIGQRNSLAQYISRELSNRIGRHELAHFERRALSNSRITAISFSSPEGEIISSLVGAGFPTVVYRWVG